VPLVKPAKRWNAVRQCPLFAHRDGRESTRCGRTTLSEADIGERPLAGIYRFTRNPMYVGLALVLLGWAALLSSPWALLGPLVFVLYINRFQIAPEERVLSAKFGAAYTEYIARVRRWL